MQGHRLRLPLAILVAVAAAGAATFLLRPRSGLIEPAAVDSTAYFSPAELERAHDFNDPQRLLGALGLALSGGTLVLLAARPPRRLLERAGRRPLLGAAAAGAGISVLLVVVGLPVDAVAHQRAADVGVSTQTWGPWLGDMAKSAAIGAVFAAVGGALALGLVRRIRRHWWAPAAAAVVAFGALSVYLFPVVIDPLFNRFDPLPRGELRSDVLSLARRAEVDVGQVYRVDASRRTTGANAYVNGLGRTKRVVLYDTLIRDFPEDQVRSVVAHELGHEKHRDLVRGLAWLALVAPAGTWLVQALAERIGRFGAPRPLLAGPSGRFGAGSGLFTTRPVAARPGPEVVPALALSVALVSFALGCASNVLSRQVEGAADGFSLRLTRDPAAFIGLERNFTIKNVGDPDPPAAFQLLFGTHPTTVQRIGFAETWARQH